MNQFKGYTNKTFQFLKDLQQNNNREWFEANRSTYEKELLNLNKSFVIEMGEHLQALVPSIKFIPKVGGSLFRINRDTRFSKDKSPYKNHFGIFFWEGSSKKMENSGFYFHAETDRLFTGAGFYCFDKRILAGYREYIKIDKNVQTLQKIIIAMQKKGFKIFNKKFKRTPSGMDKTSPYHDLYLYNGLYAEMEIGYPEWLYDERLVDELFKIYENTLPLHQWLVEMLKSIPKD